MAEHVRPSEAVGALNRAVGDLQGGDPFRRVTVLVPSPATALSVRRRLAAGRAIVNVEMLTPLQVATSIAGSALAATGRTPLSTSLRRAAIAAAVRSAASDGPGLGPAGEHVSTIDALDRRFRELRGLSRPALDALRADDRATAVLDVFDRYRERVADRWYDESDLMIEAARRVSDDPAAARKTGAVVCYALDHVQLSSVERRLVDALVAQAGTAITLDTTSPFTATAAVVAPDAETEVRLAVRALLDEARSGTTFSEMAVMTPGEPYDRLVTELLDAAGIPWGGGAPTALSTTVPGRVLVQLLGLHRVDLSRSAVARLLASGPVLDPATGRAAPAAAWEDIARNANVIAGRDQWATRLDAYVTALEERLEPVEPEESAVEAEADQPAGEEPAPRAGRLEQARALRDFVATLAAASDPPAAGSWASYTGWALRLLGSYLRPSSRADGEVFERVTSAVAQLSALDGMGPAPDVPRFVEGVEAALRAGVAGRSLGAGVTVARAPELVGGQYQLVVALGLVEGTMPPRRRDDPLIPDAVRVRTAGELLTRRERRNLEHDQLLAVLSAAPRQLLSAAAADQRAQQRRNVSPWMVEWSPPVRGERPRRGSDLERVASFSAAVLTGEPATDQEAVLQCITAGCDPAEVGLGVAAAAVAARDAVPVSEWDGAVGPHEAIDLEDRILSPTSVETWATCPFQFFLKSVLRVNPTKEPEERLETDPLDRGSLVHEILERFVRWWIQHGDPAVDEELEALDRFTDEVFNSYEVAGRVGRPLAWMLEQRQLRAHLRLHLARDRERRRTTGLRPVGAEATFGFPDEPGDLGPVTVDLPSGRLTFRGKIDRIDATPDGTRVRVVDYKTGSSGSYSKMTPTAREPDPDPTLSGRRLQLPVYAKAARLAYPDAEVVAAYDFVTDAKAGYPTVPVALDERNTARFEQVLEHIASSIGDGLFPANPGDVFFDTFENCSRCDYERVCPTRRGEAFERRQAEEAIVRFLRLSTRDPDDPGAGGDR